MTYPAIGIRPTIDGRRNGVRESLEDQTMAMAKNAAKLISDNVRYPNGEPVRCVVADTTIGGSAEATAAAEKFAKENVCASLTVTPCWCYGTETMDTTYGIPKAVWGFNGTERPGAVYLAAVLAAHAQNGMPAFSIYGREVQDADDTSVPDDVKEKLLRFARAALAVGLMKGKSYVNIGSVSMGIMGSYMDMGFYRKYLGMRAEFCDMSEVSARVTKGIYDPDEYKKAIAWVKKNIKEGIDTNKNPKSREEKDADMEYSVKMALVCRDIIVGNPKLAEMGYIEESNGRGGIAGGFQGQRMWTDHLPNGDFMESILCTSFDWNGKREPYVVATENDNLNGLAMLFLHLLTQQAAGFADVRTCWSSESIKRVTNWTATGHAKDGLIHLINSGACSLDAAGAMKDSSGKAVMKPYWEITDSDIEATLAATEYCSANLQYFRGGGFSSRFETKAEMPITLVRVNLVDGLGPVLQLAAGYSCQLPNEVSDTLWKRTDYTWPCTWFAPRLTGKGAFKDTYSVMANWGANHGAFTYGHLGEDIISLAAMLRIPVSMHNVPEEQIYRPHAWAAFGTMDLEGADYRACAQFGPLYG